MRPKFRAWDKKNQRMVTVWTISWKAWDGGDEINYVEVEYDDGTYQLMEHEVVLLESTGLHDKNGKEIWEGDILGWPIRSIGMNEIVRMATHIVKWVEQRKNETFGHGDFGESLTAGFYFDGYLGLPETSEVIGNIYENPELVK